MDVELWPRGVRMIVRGRPQKKRPSKRGLVDEFSPNSRRNLAWAYAQGPWCGMLTLTYPGSEIIPKNETKSHLNAFLQHLRRRDIGYLWIMEFQRRGQVHYHVWVSRNLSERTDIVTADKIRRHFPWRRLMLSWLAIIGEAENEKAKRVALHPASYCQWEVRVGNNYAAKYADKRRQKGLPAGVDTMGRWWARSRKLSEPNYRTEFDEGADAKTCRRVVHKYLCRVFKGRKNLFWTPNQGIRVSLNEKHHENVCRVLIYYLGSMLDGRPRTGPDTPSQSYREAMSTHRLIWSRGDGE